jgi:hypothetical protein
LRMIPLSNTRWSPKALRLLHHKKARGGRGLSDGLDG